MVHNDEIQIIYDVEKPYRRNISLEVEDPITTPSVVTTQVEKDQLDLLKESAELNDVNLVILAEEGENFETDTNYPATVSKGKVAIRISENKTRGIVNFWKTEKLLIGMLPEIRIG